MAALVLLFAAVVAWFSGAADPLLDRIDAEAVDALIARAGPAGPLLIVALMTLAVVASPIPSAPIALAAGAAYGHYFGAAYVAVGAELGAMAAFLIARHLGRDAVLRLLGGRADRGLLGSQNALTLTVFASRLAPFVSFDAISYAAGLSRLHLWRFLLATLAGIAPASFALAHFGSEAARGDPGRAVWFALALGLLTAGPLVLVALRRPRRGSAAPGRPGENAPSDREAAP
ncbi:MAG: TVP38/TMEM64 family protein [Pseudomonadota bacterium]